MGQQSQRVRPESPQRPQQRRKGAEIKNRAAQCAQRCKSPQLPFGPPQEKEKGSPAHDGAVNAVQQPRKARCAETERAQEIIQHPGAQAQQNGLSKYPELPDALRPHV